MAHDNPTRGIDAAAQFEADEPSRMFTRGGFVLTTEPYSLWWNGRPVALSPLELRLMHLLMVRGKGDWATIEQRLAMTPVTRDTIVHRLRRKLREAGALDALVTVRNWGLRLQLAPDAHRRVWIGADERHQPQVMRAAG